MAHTLRAPQKVRDRVGASRKAIMATEEEDQDGADHECLRDRAGNDKHRKNWRSGAATRAKEARRQMVKGKGAGEE